MDRKVAKQDPLVQDLDRLEAGVRIAAANKRIDELERQVGALQATPEKLDLDLLSRRVEALEVKANGGAADLTESSVKDTSGPSRSPVSAAPTPDRAATPVKRKPAPTPPDAKARPRLATPDEIKDFTNRN